MKLTEKQMDRIDNAIALMVSGIIIATCLFMLVWSFFTI